MNTLNEAHALPLSSVILCVLCGPGPCLTFRIMPNASHRFNTEDTEGPRGSRIALAEEGALIVGVGGGGFVELELHALHSIAQLLAGELLAEAPDHDREREG